MHDTTNPTLFVRNALASLLITSLVDSLAQDYRGKPYLLSHESKLNGPKLQMLDKLMGDQKNRYKPRKRFFSSVSQLAMWSSGHAPGVQYNSLS